MPGIGIGIGVGLTRLASGGSAAWTKVLAATQWNAIANAKESRTATGYVSRFSGYVGSNPLKIIKLNFPAIFLSSASTGLATNLGNDIPIQKCSIEYAGVIYQVTFSGLRTKNVVDGTVTVWADDIDVQTAFGIPSLAVNARIDVKFEALLGSTAHSMPSCGPRGVSTDTGQVVWFYDPALTTIVNGTDSPGAYTSSGTAPQARSSGYTPFIFGVHTVQSDALLARGDSITADTGDSGTNTSGLGWFQRMLGKFTKKMAGLNLAVHGSTRLAGINDTRITDYYQYASIATIFYGANDFGTSGTGNTVATVRADVLNMRDALRAAGIRIVAVCKTIPRTNTTDGWVTELNQTPLTGWDSASSLPILYNDSLNTTDFDAVIPFDSIRGVTSVYKALAPPARLFDTTHPNAAGYGDMSTESTAIIQPFILY